MGIKEMSLSAHGCAWAPHTHVNMGVHRRCPLPAKQHANWTAHRCPRMSVATHRCSSTVHWCPQIFMGFDGCPLIVQGRPLAVHFSYGLSYGRPWASAHTVMYLNEQSTDTTDTNRSADICGESLDIRGRPWASVHGRLWTTSEDTNGPSMDTNG